jgi:oxaloacetate decarboxylase gamma subunit
MEEINLVSEGVKFMILGMGTVFVFLIVMIAVLNLQAKIVGKYFPQTSGSQNSNRSSASKKNVNAEDEKRKVAAVVGAISAYKK